MYHLNIFGYSIEPKDKIYVNGYGFLSFAKNMGKYSGSKYGQKLLDSAKELTTGAIKTASKRAIQNTAAATGDWIADKITSISKKSKKPQNNEANDESGTPKERYISPEERK